MYFAAALIVYVCIAEGAAEQTAAQSTACSNADGATCPTDGFSLLRVGVIFRLAKTTFQSLSSGTFRCIIAKTTQKDENQHQVTEWVRYMVSDSFTNTYEFTQSFQFTQESGRYNKMTSIDNTTAPHSSYQFLWVDPACTVLEYLFSPLDPEGEAQPQSRDSGTDDAKKRPRDCMLWVEGLEGQPSAECENKFNQLCSSVSRHSFTTKGCDALYNVAKHEDSSSAENLEATEKKSQDQSR
uniref:Lipocalin/cytosolic fatty-acid binding domain-containing protein n=1 Tax=Amblyomma maculatum TaxID=34609 RepID=G3MRZ4_AMBMU